MADKQGTSYYDGRSLTYHCDGRSRISHFDGRSRTWLMIAIATCGWLSGCSSTPVACHDNADNRRVVDDFVRLFYVERDVQQAFERYVTPDYVQHNPNIADGRDNAIAALTPLFSNRSVRIEVRRVIVDGDMAVVHIFAQASPEVRGAAVADIFRLSHGRIVEHWDILQDIPEHAVNPHPMF